MYTLKLKHHFDSSHKLCLDYESPCQNIHGHRWIVQIEIKSEILNENGMIIDFKHLKNIINELDHQHLNHLVKFNPTAENLSKYIYDKIKEFNKLSDISITIWESPEASIKYEPSKD